MAMNKNVRPKHLNLLKIKLPVAGVLSIAHRVSGLLMVLAIPFVIYLLDLSLRNEAGFTKVIQLWNCLFLKLIVLGLIWSVVHHFIAGIRFLLIDIDVGVEKETATKSAWVVFILEIVVMMIILGMML